MTKRVKRTKKYKATVMIPFCVGSGDNRKAYKVGDKFETTNEASLTDLINKKRLKL